MRVAFCVAAALVALPATAGASPPTSAAAGASPARAGARPIVLTLSLHTLLECGRIQAQTIVVVLPAQLHVPRTIPTVAVRVARLHPRSVALRARTLTIKQRARSGPVCLSLTFGPAKIVFTRAARIGNPARPGRYVFRVELRGRSLRAVLRVR